MKQSMTTTVGTRSVLFGAHCFFLHPWFVAAAWWQLYGWRKVYIGYAPGYPGSWRWRLGFRGGPTFASLRDPRLWLVFFVHDLGYFGKPNMDGPEGELHPYFGARVMSWLCDPGFPSMFGPIEHFGRWGCLALYHSRYLAKKLGAARPSPLCIADKLSIALTPAWLYLPMVTATGEVREYLKNAQRSESSNWTPTGFDKRVWYAALRKYMREWVAAHRDGAADTWTSANRHARSDEGVWQ